jgi:hypothetical protein
MTTTMAAARSSSDAVELIVARRPAPSARINKDHQTELEAKDHHRAGELFLAFSLAADGPEECRHNSNDCERNACNTNTPALNNSSLKMPP